MVTLEGLRFLNAASGMSGRWPLSASASLRPMILSRPWTACAVHPHRDCKRSWRPRTHNAPEWRVLALALMGSDRDKQGHGHEATLTPRVLLQARAVELPPVEPILRRESVRQEIGHTEWNPRRALGGDRLNTASAQTSVRDRSFCTNCTSRQSATEHRSSEHSHDIGEHSSTI